MDLLLVDVSVVGQALAELWTFNPQGQPPPTVLTAADDARERGRPTRFAAWRSQVRHRGPQPDGDHQSYVADGALAVSGPSAISLNVALVRSATTISTPPTMACSRPNRSGSATKPPPLKSSRLALIPSQHRSVRLDQHGAREDLAAVERQRHSRPSGPARRAAVVTEP